MISNVPAKLNSLVESDLKTGQELVKTFQWRDRNGRYFWPKDMETRHVFFTIRMIWNNFMPKHMAFSDARLYHFGPSYTPAYLREALIVLWHELEERKPLPSEYQRQLEWMHNWLRNPMTRDAAPRIKEAPKALPKPLWDE